MRFKNLDLIAAMLVAAINVGWTLVPDRPPGWGIIFALPLIFIVPGYTLTQTLFHKRSPGPVSSRTLIRRPNLIIGQPISAADHIILTLGLSMTIDVVTGFTLDIMPVGLQALSWALSLGLVTTVLALLAAFRRRKKFVKVAKIARSRHSLHEYILFGLAILLIIVAVWSSIVRPIVPQPSFTQFWMLPAQNNSCAVSVGVQSFETTSITYRIVMTINGSQVNTWSSIVLSPQEEWHKSVSIKPGATQNTYIEARLYRVDRPEIVYRNVHLTFYSVTRSKDERPQQCSLQTK